jgi:glycosyltransferase involved in cell wall biosynthesis
LGATTQSSAPAHPEHRRAVAGARIRRRRGDYRRLTGEQPLIALDARLVGYAAGIARYAVLLAQALDDLDGPERYVVLRGRRAHDLGGRKTIERRAFTPPHHRLERWVLPLDLLRQGLKPRLLHSIDHVAPAWGAWRSVVTLHDLAFLLYPATHTPASRAYYAATGESVRRAQRVIAVSQRTAADAVRLLGLDPVRVRVVYEAAGPAFSPQPRDAFMPLASRLKLPADRPYVLFVGTLEPRKNLPLLFEAMTLVRQKIDADLVVVGGRGWLDEPIFAAHAASGLADAVHFVGWLNEADLAVLYSHAGVLVLPSLYEGFGLTILEAMACGAPVISSNAGPLLEVAGDAAVLLPPEDARRWAEAIGRALTDQRHAESLRQRGLRRAGEFSWRQTALATREVYREALLG